MDGIQLIRLLDVLPTTSISNAIGVSPRSLIVKGFDFSSVDQVLINGSLAPSFVVYSKTELIAEVPAAIADSVITEVVVLSALPTMTERSLIEFTIGSRIRKLTGVQRLVQNFVRLLLRTTGSNLFHPTSGGGLMKRIGTNTNSQAAADIAVAITTTKQFIIAAQTQTRGLSNEERLLNAEIGGITPDPFSGSIYVTLVLTSFAGERSAATLIA